MTTSGEHPLTTAVNLHLADLLATRSQGGTKYLLPAQKLLNQLGFPYLDDWGAVQYLMVTPDDKAAINTAVPQLMGAVGLLGPALTVNDIVGLLMAFHRTEDWTLCYSSENAAYGMASLLCDVLGNRSEFDVELDGMGAETIVVDICNKWLKPSKPFTTLPDMQAVVAALFGDAWAALATSLMGDSYLAVLITQQRPPFLPGLCPGQSPQVSAPLPELGFPT